MQLHYYYYYIQVCHVCCLNIESTILERKRKKFCNFIPRVYIERNHTSIHHYQMKSHPLESRRMKSRDKSISRLSSAIFSPLRNVVVRRIKRYQHHTNCIGKRYYSLHLSSITLHYKSQTFEHCNDALSNGESFNLWIADLHCACVRCVYVHSVICSCVVYADKRHQNNIDVSVSIMPFLHYPHFAARCSRSMTVFSCELGF